MSKFGETIRSLRTSKGLKVKDLAESIGVNPVYLTQIEKHGKLPSKELLIKIIDALDYPNLFYPYLLEKYPDIFELAQFVKETYTDKNVRESLLDAIPELKEIISDKQKEIFKELHNLAKTDKKK